MSSNYSNLWNSFYAQRAANHVYPKEWVVRVFAGGNYPNLKMDKSRYRGASILDLGCGDGRHIEFLTRLGFSVSATEISDEIIRILKTNALSRGWSVTLSKGKASALPYDDCRFDYVLASASCNYVDDGQTFEDNLREISRILKPDGIFVGSIPDCDTDIMRGATRTSDGLALIANDPQQLRNGATMYGAESEHELKKTLAPYFGDITVGTSRNDFFGYVLNYFIFVCRKLSTTP